MTVRCSHVRSSGARCSRSARDGHETCAAHDPARPKKSTASAVDTAPIVESVVEHEASPRHPSAPAADNVLDGALVERTQLLNERGAEVWHTDWRGLLDRARGLGGVDSLIVDAPYSERTHAGHDEQAAHIPSEDGIRRRRRLQYACWGRDDVDAFVDAWAPLVRNWLVSLTDSDLAPLWRAAFDRCGLLSFARIPSIESGATVRFNGDGPPNWTVDVMVARTRDSRHQGAWRPQPYYLNPREAKAVVGGKPLSLMRALVRDYTRPGDLVCDPCCGAGTTGLAAIMEGRRALLGDAMEEHARLAVERLREMPGETKAGQLALLAK